MKLKLAAVMQKLLITLSFIAPILVGCSGAGEDAGLVPTDYGEWASTVDAPLTYQIPGHSMLKRIIFINGTGQKVMPVEKDGKAFYDYPHGTIIVKEMYPNSESTKPDHLTVMIKDPDHPNAMVGWVWLVKSIKTGQEEVFESSDFCVTCHRNANDRHPYGDRNPEAEFRDYVYYPWRAP
ncbi:MAG: hypothetical protein CMN78_05690 [Spirochaetales bacterium]|nr:hypothetical protein [Spirochaetales bacterium]